MVAERMILNKTSEGREREDGMGVRTSALEWRFCGGAWERAPREWRFCGGDWMAIGWWWYGNSEEKESCYKYWWVIIKYCRIDLLSMDWNQMSNKSRVL